MIVFDAPCDRCGRIAEWRQQLGNVTPDKFTVRCDCGDPD